MNIAHKLDGNVEMKWRNFYRCPRCGHEWDDCWDSQCDDDCLKCGCRHISPYESEETDQTENMKEIKLPCHDITIHLEREHTAEESGCGTIASGLKDPNNAQLNAAIDGLESLILAHACAGVHVESPAYIEGIETAVDAIFNHFAL
jgi:predicted  nucleic acid-binding Zn-ribbon protein